MTPLAAPQATATQGAPALPAATANQARAEQQGKEFEAVFLSTMLGQMFSGLQTDGPFHGGHAEKQFQSLLAEELGNALAESGGIGLADAVTRELIALQEESGQ